MWLSRYWSFPSLIAANPSLARRVSEFADVTPKWRCPIGTSVAATACINVKVQAGHRTYLPSSVWRAWPTVTSVSSSSSTTVLRARLKYLAISAGVAAAA